ncbi:hypothetical protein [Streptomyces sp. NBC_00557]|uniref:hypothetical protein n=1 Tax=Streptomyces sp. NBC_00557 TaxID=2975776 RepID=UPI002E821B63|nr:hypothetical protein [Streptomyces sp. NBC_00557]WUC39233.1 hypothetical protein OG956_35890 [Streptomyces sp. NBC_00557]
MLEVVLLPVSDVDRSLACNTERLECHLKVQGRYLVVPDLEAACAELVERGGDVGQMMHKAPPRPGRRQRERQMRSTAPSPRRLLKIPGPCIAGETVHGCRAQAEASGAGGRGDE